MAQVSTSMAMTNRLSHIEYEKMNFNYNYMAGRHPQTITEKHYVYHLYRDERGYLICVRDKKGEPLRSPRLAYLVCSPAGLEFMVPNYIVIIFLGSNEFALLALVTNYSQQRSIFTSILNV